MSGKKKKFHEKEAEEEKKSTAQEAEVVHTDPVIQDQTEASHVEEQPQAQVHMQDQRASQMHPQEQSQQSSQIHTQEQPASAELYEQLEAQLRTLRAESAKMQSGPTALPGTSGFGSAGTDCSLLCRNPG